MCTLRQGELEERRGEGRRKGRIPREISCARERGREIEVVRR
jgi:hypothetical protein